MRGRLAAAALLLLAGSFAATAQPASPVGTWRTFSDRTGQESGQVQIWDQAGLLYGRIVGIRDPAKRDVVCDKCTDDRRGQKVMGMQIIRGMKPDGTQWDGGEILDPETGSTYRCLMRLADGGRKLIVRGFIGISLFGRSQTWLRAE